MRDPFVHLCVHSLYSLCEGTLEVEKIMKLCEDMSMPAIALTDTNNLFGALEFATKAASHGVQPITACQVNVCYGENNRKVRKEHIRLYAQNENGYFNLMQIVTSAHLTPFCEGFPSVSMSLLEQYSDDLIVLTGGENSALNHMLSNNHIDDAVQYTDDMQRIFKDRLYIEIQRHHVQGEYEIEEHLLNIAYDKQIPIVATNNVCFATPDYKEAHEILLCIGEGTTINDENHPRSNSEYYMKSPEEMKKLFIDIPEAYQNTSLIAQRCSFLMVNKKPIMPEVKTEGCRTQDEQLRKMAIDGLEMRLESFKSNPDYEKTRALYYDRLEYELNMISRMGFSGYFLIICDYVQWAKSHNIPVGPGRGSGAGSLVAYALTITNVDPMRFKLFFERFLNPERVSMPDFDIDFCQSRRDEVIQYVQDHYGRESVAQIITFGKLQARAAVKDVGRAMGIPYVVTDRIAKLIPQVPTNPVTLAQAIEQEQPLKDEIANDYQVKRLMDIALKLEGMCKHTSVHAAGIVITDKIIRHIAPMYKDPKASMPVTQFSMKYVENAGLIKFDFLGLKTLTVIQKAVDLINAKGIKFAIDAIPLDDKKTFELLRNIDCLGIFQLESGGMKDVIKKLQPDKIEDIIALVALYRPGPMDDIPKYIACKHGVEPITYLDPRLEPILSETYGVMVYQEQVMQIAQVIGGYSLGQADILRRAMGKKQHDEMQRQQAKFVEGAQKNGLSEIVSVTIFNLMSKFASYGFNKSHSTPYGLITYQTAYLKANYTIEFFTSIMTLDMDSTDKLNLYFTDAKKHGITISPPDINLSGDDFAIDYERNSIIYSLSALKGSGKPAVHAIEQERKDHGKFESIFDFVERMKRHNVINRRLLECFIKAGAFDSLHNNRHQLYTAIDMLLSIGGDEDQGMLFEKCYPDLPNINEWSVSEKLSGELEAIGFYLSAHPMQEHEALCKRLGVLSIAESSSFDSARLAGIVMSAQRKTAKNDSKFLILSLSDQSGAVDIMFFSETYYSYADILVPGNMLVIDVNITKNEDNIRYTATAAHMLSPDIKLSKFDYSYIEPITKSTKKITVKIQNSGDLKKVQNVVSGLQPGNIQIELEIPQDGVKITLKGTFNVSIRTILELRRLIGETCVSSL